MLELLVTFALAAGIAPVVMWWYRKQKWLTDPVTSPHAKHVHTQPLPRGGGVVVGLAIVVAALFFLQIDKYLIAILAGIVILIVVGMLDDIYDLHPLLRLLTGLSVALLVVGVGVGIPYVSNPFGPGVIRLDQPQLVLDLLGKTRHIWIMADMLAVLFIVWNMNIVNWAKGLDGQLPGFVSTALIVVGILSLRFTDDPNQFNTTLLCFIGAGAFLGLLVWNWYPQKLLAGYGAGSIAGFLLSILAILSGAKVATVLMVLAIPTADAIFAVLRRIAAGKAPYWGDRGHLHHKLLDVLGWTKPQVALFYWFSSLVLGVLSLYLNTAGKLVTIGLVTGVVFGFLIWAKLNNRVRT